MSFFSELKQRNVLRVAAAYAVTAWLLIQVAETVFPLFGFDETPARIVVVLMAVGFVPTLILAWIYEITPDGLKKEEDVDRRQHLRRVSGRKLDFAIIGVLVIAVGFLSYRQLIGQLYFPEVARLPQEITSPKPDARSIAVLRFANFGVETSFSNGLSEQLLNLLAGIGDLKVPSRQATWSLGDENLDTKRIAKALSVRFLLDGSVQQQEQQIRVTARLIEGSSGSQIWSETYEEILSADNFFNIQDAIASQVVEKLGVMISKDTASEVAERGTEDDDALQYYLTGREELTKPKTDGSMLAAVTAFEFAIAADPHFAEAHAGLCDAQLAWYVTYRSPRYFDAGEAACVRGLRINQNLGEVYAALGTLHRYGGQFDEAEKDLIKARQLLNDPALVLEELGRTYRAQNKLVLAEQAFNEAIAKDPANWSVYKSMANFLFRTGRYEAALPYYKQVTVMQRNSALAYTNIGSAFFMLGDFDNSTVAFRRSLELEPTHIAYNNFGNSLYYQGRFQESVDMYRKAIEVGEDDARVWGSLAASCEYASGEEQCSADAYARAIELINDSLTINPLDAESLAHLAAYLARTGENDEALQTLNRLDRLNWNDPDVPFFKASAYIALGDTRSALSELSQAVVMGYPRLLLAAEPDFISLRKDPEFRELVKEQLQPP